MFGEEIILFAGQKPTIMTCNREMHANKFSLPPGWVGGKNCRTIY